MYTQQSSVLTPVLPQLHYSTPYGGGAVRFGTARQPGRRWVLFPMGSLKFFIDFVLRPHYGLKVDSVSNINEYQEYFLGG